MRARGIVGLIIAVIASHSAVAQSVPTDGARRARVLAFAQASAGRALTFTKGDAATLRAAQRDFTDAGWRAYLKSLEGFLDPGGAPQFSSSFTPAGPGVIAREDQGVLRVRIPGELVQWSGGSRTTYRVAIEVEVAGEPPRIVQLTQTTCGGEAARHYCM